MRRPNDNMISFLPKTKFGRLSAIFIVFFFLCFLILNIFVLAGQRGGKGFFSNLYLAIPGILAAFFGITSFIFGFFSIFWKKERGILVLISTLIGLLIIVFILGEIFSPH